MSACLFIGTIVTVTVHILATWLGHGPEEPVLVAGSWQLGPRPQGESVLLLRIGPEAIPLCDEVPQFPSGSGSLPLSRVVGRPPSKSWPQMQTGTMDSRDIAWRLCISDTLRSRVS